MAQKTVVETQGATIAEAIAVGLDELGVERSEVALEVLDEGSRGVLGIGKRDAIVRLTIMSAEARAQRAKEAAAQAAAEKAAAAEAATAAEESTAPPVTSKPKAAESKKQEADDNEDDDDRIARLQLTDEELQREAEVAEDIVKSLIDRMQIDATVTVEIGEKDDRDLRVPQVSIDGDDLSALIGHRGDVLNRLQFLVRSMTSQRLQDKSTLVIDIDNFRETRIQTLVDVAKKTADKAVNFRRPLALEPMPPHERRIIHMTLRDDDRVTTESKGEGDRRRVRVIPKGVRISSNRGGRGGYRGGGRGGNRGGRGGYRGGNRNRYDN